MPHVLVLDHDDDIRASLCTLLAEEGYSVATPHDAASALHQLTATCDPLILLFDLSLPTEQDKLLLATLAHHPDLASRHAYICMSTSTLLSVEIRDLLTQLDVPILMKPFELDELLAAVKKAASSVPASAHAKRAPE